MSRRRGGVSRSVRGGIGVPAPWNQPQQRGLVQDMSVNGITQIQQYTERVEKRRKIVESGKLHILKGEVLTEQSPQR